MNRREPLSELPLERFLVSDPSDLRSTRNGKRPLSPGTPSLFSPAKRRILNEEGVFSPEKTVKPPLFVSSQTLGSPARFCDVLVGPSSPARVLDFGKRKIPQPQVSSFDPTISTPKTSSSVSRRLVPSPELKAPSSRAAVVPSFDDKAGPFINKLQRPPKMTWVMVPRELPPPPDPTSIHYPGFVVYQDPCVAEYSPANDDEDSAMEEDYNQELDKENARPRRPTKKAASAPNVETLKTPVSAKKSKSLANTPQRHPFSTPERIYSPLPEHFSSQESYKSTRSSHRLFADGMDTDDDY